MLPFSLALGASVAWGGADFLAGLKSREISVVHVMAVSQVAGLVIISAVVIALGEGMPDGKYLAWAAASGFFGVASLAAFYRGLAVGTMSVVAPIAACDAIVPVVGGAAIGEGLGDIQLAGAFVILCGVAMVSTPSEKEAGGKAASAGAGFGLLAALGFGCFTMALDQASEGGVLWALLINRATSVVLLTAALVMVRPESGVRGEDCKMLVAIGVLDLVATALLSLASTQGLISQVGLLGSMYPVVTVVLARIFLRERLDRAQQAGAVGALGGAAVLSVA